MTASLSPIVKQQFFDDSGNPLASGKLYTYIAGSNTPIATYKTAAGNDENTNPIILNARGECDIWLSSSIAYKFKLCDLNNVEIWTVDNITVGGTSSSGGTVDWSSITNRPTTFPPSPHNQNWTTIINTPTTLDGYGITDVYTKTEMDNWLGQLFQRVINLEYFTEGQDIRITALESSVSAINSLQDSVSDIFEDINIINANVNTFSGDITNLLDSQYKVKTTTEDTAPGFLNNKLVAGDGMAISLDETNRLKFDATSMDDHKVQAHQYSTEANYAGSVLQAGAGIDISLTPDLNKLVIKATGTAVGGFYWKGAWDELTAYNSNDSVWYFDNTVTPVVNRLYIAMEPNQGINPIEDTSGIWSEMMRVDTLGDMFVAVDEDDVQTGYLIDKIREGSGIVITRHTDIGGNAYLALNSTCLYSVTIGGVTKHSPELAGGINFTADGGSAVAWDGNNVKISSISLGETSSTAYRGDRGKTAYDHSQTSGNPHGTDFSELENKPTTLAGYGITDAMSAVNGVVTTQDWNNFTTTGVYNVVNWNGANGPIAGTYSAYKWGQLVVDDYSGVITQTYYSHLSTNIYFRVYLDGSWGGWKTSAPTNYGNVDSATNWDNLTSTGKYRVTAVGGTNGPSTAYPLGVLLVDYAADDYIQQTYFPTYGNGTPVCRQRRSGTWGGWYGSISGGTGMSLNTQIHYQSVTASRSDSNAIYLCY